jgi:RND family efflux transporter MFP subunit
MKPFRTLFATAGLLAAAACSSDREASAAPPVPALQTIAIRPAGAASGRAWDGVIEAVQQADLTAQTSGRVTAVSVDINDRVAAGQVLLRLTAVEQQAGANTARAQVRAAEAAAIEAEATYRRFAALAADHYVSRAQLDQSRAARDAAVAARDAARAQLAQAGQQADYTVVRAPFAGIISARRVEPGESVAPGQPLLSIHAPGALRIEVQVPQSEAGAIRAAGRAQVLLADGRRTQAAQVIVFPAADMATHSVAVRVMLPDLEQAPQPGETAKVVFPIAAGATDTAPIVRIPRSAVVQRGEVSGVYVVVDGQPVLRQLRLGRSLGNEVEVLAGLVPGDIVAADPVAAVQARLAQRDAGSGHE